jgi:hypothetical protein
MRRIALGFPLLGFACLSQAPAPLPSPSPAAVAGVPVVTQHNDNARTGANLRETILAPSTVSQKTFGRLFSRQVQGYVYAQPLYVPQLEIGGRVRNVVFVATEHDDLYAFDADDPLSTEPLWHDNFGTPVVSEHLDVYQGTPYRDIIPEVGITSTPVIDLQAGTLYVYAQTEDAGAFGNDLHAIDILTGKERAGSPKRVVVSGPGSAPEAENGVITTEQKFLLQRPGLAIDRGTLWVAGGGHGDFGAYHGWVQAYDAATLELRGTYMTTPDGWAGGIWQSGNGISIDEAGDAYFQTGNGTFDPNSNPPNVANAFVRLTLGKTLDLADWFAPFNQAALNEEDGDLGSSGPVLIPGTTLVVGGGKEGKLYLMDRSSLGHYRTTDDGQVLQSFQATFGSANKHIHAGPIWWDGTSGLRIYILSESDSIRSYRFDGKRFETSPWSVSDLVMPPGTPGGAMSLSANGKESGILWALTQSDSNASGYVTGHGALHALDAEDLRRELYSSIGTEMFDYVKFSVPTVAGGKVFVGTASNELLVFGVQP